MTLLSWIGTVCILVGMWYIGDKKWWAFIFSIVGELAYIIYALPKKQYALAFLSIAILCTVVRSLIKWRQA